MRIPVLYDILLNQQRDFLKSHKLFSCIFEEKVFDKDFEFKISVEIFSIGLKSAQMDCLTRFYILFCSTGYLILHEIDHQMKILIFILFLYKKVYKNHPTLDV